MSSVERKTVKNLMELNDTVKEGVAVFIAACRLGFEPESEVGAGKGPKGEAIVLVKRRSTEAFVVSLGHPAGAVTWEYFLESWKETTQEILRGEHDPDKVYELFESTMFCFKLAEFVDGLIENGLLQLQDIRRMNNGKQTFQARSQSAKPNGRSY